MPTPHGQALALALLKVTPTHHSPPGVAGEDAAAGFDLVVQVGEAGEPGEWAADLYERLEPPGVHVLAVARNVPSAREHKPSTGRRMIKYGFSRSGRVPTESARNEHNQHPVAPSDCELDDLRIVCCSRNHGDPSLKSVELAHALLTADTDHLVAPVQRMLHHVPPELPGGADDADLHERRLSNTQAASRGTPQSRTTHPRPGSSRGVGPFGFTRRGVGGSIPSPPITGFRFSRVDGSCAGRASVPMQTSRCYLGAWLAATVP